MSAFFYILGCLISFALTTWLLWFALCLIAKGSFLVFASFGSNLRERVISLGLATLIFPAVATALFQAILQFITALLKDIPTSLETAWNNAQPLLTAGKSETPIWQIRLVRRIPSIVRLLSW